MAKKIPVDTQQLHGVILQKVDGMRTGKKHCEFLIKVGSEEIPVHRNIICASSDYFDAMFSHPTRENESGVVEMIGVDPECAIICVDHMYGKEVSILPDKYEPLMYAANLMQLHTLRDAITTLLEADLHPKSFFTAKRIANMYGSKKLEEKCNEFAEENFIKISKEKEFGELDKSDIEKMINSKTMKISEEEGMIECVNISKLSVGFRRYLAESEPVISENTKLFRFFCISMLDSMKIVPKTTPEKRGSDTNAMILFDKSSSQLQCFDPGLNSLTKVCSMKGEMKTGDFSAVTLGDYIYVLMGDRSVHRLKFPIDTGSWERVADMLEARPVYPQCCILSGFIWVVGGFDSKTRSVEKYDPDSNTWMKDKDRPQPSKYSEVLAARGYIYCFGGYINGPVSNLVEKFDPESTTWTKLAPMIEAKAFVTATELNGHIYVLGGYSGPHLSTAERYDLRLNQWTAVKSMNVCRSWFRSFAIGGMIYAVGGRNSSPGSIEKYDAERNEWKIIEIPSGMKVNILEALGIRSRN